MGRLELKRNRRNFEINLFEGSKGSESYYRNILTPNPKVLAQILIDLELYGYPMDEAIRIYLKRIGNKDWLGL